MSPRKSQQRHFFFTNVNYSKMYRYLTTVLSLVNNTELLFENLFEKKPTKIFECDRIARGNNECPCNVAKCILLYEPPSFIRAV